METNFKYIILHNNLGFVYSERLYILSDVMRSAFLIGHAIANSGNTVFTQRRRESVVTEYISLVAMWRASDWKALAGRCIWQGKRAFYASGRALTDIPHSAGDAQHHRNSYTRPYTNSGSTERCGNGDRFSAVVSGYAAWVCMANTSWHVLHRSFVSWSPVRETGSRVTSHPGPPLALPRSMRITGWSLSHRVSPRAASRTCTSSAGMV